MRPSRLAPTVYLASLAAWPLVATPVSAQPPQAPPQVAPPAPRGFDVEQRVAELTQRLQLDTTQARQVRSILEDAQRRMQALRSAGAPRDEGFREQRRAILFEVEDRIWAILTCPQKDAFRLYIRDQIEERFERRMHGGGGGPGGPGGPGYGPGYGPRGRGPGR